MDNTRDFGEGVPHVHPMSHQDVTLWREHLVGAGQHHEAEATQHPLLVAAPGQADRAPRQTPSPSALDTAGTVMATAHQGTGKMPDRAHGSLCSPGAGCPQCLIPSWLPTRPACSEVSDPVRRHWTSSSLPKLGFTLHFLCTSVPCPVSSTYSSGSLLAHSTGKVPLGVPTGMRHSSNAFKAISLRKMPLYQNLN